MCNNFSVIICAGGFGTSFQSSYPSTPKPLVPLGHNPSICILLETVLELDEIDTIYILIFKRHLDLFQKEINRWFYDKSNIVLYPLPDTQGTGKSIEHLVNKNKIKSENLIIMYSNMPLISKITLKDMIHCFTSENQSLQCLVSKLKNKNEYDGTVLLDNEILKEIIPVIETPTSSSDYSFLNIILIKRDLLSQLIPKLCAHKMTGEYYITDIIKNYKKGANVFIINPYIANKECVIVKKMEDKNFAEEIYMEHRNIMFINQCYGLWKKCEIFENRLQFIETALKRLE